MNELAFKESLVLLGIDRNIWRRTGIKRRRRARHCARHSIVALVRARQGGRCHLGSEG